MSDYRNTKYCQELNNLVEKKNSVKDAVIKEHGKAEDIHAYISKNDKPFKRMFVEAYNGKCAYCGVSIDIISLRGFEIDHLIPKTANRFADGQTKAGHIENLILACHDCNRSKSDFQCPDADLPKINPDFPDIANSFVRDDDYYIRINTSIEHNDTVDSFYRKLDLGNQLHRIDFLFMNMIGLSRKLTNMHPAYAKLMETIVLLQEKRNLMG